MLLIFGQHFRRKRICWPSADAGSHCIVKCERWAAALTWNLIELNLSLWLPCAESFGSQNTSYEQAMHLGLWNMQSLKGPLPQSSKLIWLHCLDQVCVWSGSRLSDKNSCCSFVVLRSLSILHPLFLHQHSALLDFVSTVGLWVTMSLSLNILKADFVDLQSASVQWLSTTKMWTWWQLRDAIMPTLCDIEQLFWSHCTSLFSTWYRLQTFVQIILCHKGANISGQQLSRWLWCFLFIPDCCNW